MKKCSFYRDAMERDPYSCLLMVMEVNVMTVLLMAIHPAYTLFLSVLLVLMVFLVILMKNALQRWS